MTFRPRSNNRLPKDFKSWLISTLSDVATTCMSTFAAARLEDLYERLVYGPLAEQLKEEDEAKKKKEVKE